MDKVDVVVYTCEEAKMKSAEPAYNLTLASISEVAVTSVFDRVFKMENVRALQLVSARGLKKILG